VRVHIIFIYLEILTHEKARPSDVAGTSEGFLGKEPLNTGRIRGKERDS